MKRSEINRILREATAFLGEMNFRLPPFAYFNAQEWKQKGREYDEIRENKLGWDITDFGRGDYDGYGLLLFTIRNGNLRNPDCKKPYAEKILISQEGQITPMHFHWHKMEDIINRGGGNMMIRLYNSTPDESLADTPVQVSVDGCRRTVPAGGVLRLCPGESITLPPYLYHSFWAEEGHGSVLMGEVSMVNDDDEDNRFFEPIGRFPVIEEDEEPLYFLCNEVPKVL